MKGLTHRERVGRWLSTALGVGSDRRNAALFAAVALVMGGGYVAIRVGVETVPPMFMAALRFDLSAGLLLCYAAVIGGRLRPRTVSDVIAVLVFGGLVFAGTIGFLFVGQLYTTASVAATVMSFGPVLTALIAGVLLPDERLSRGEAVGVVLGLVGVVVVARPTPETTLTGNGLGVVFVLCAAISGSLGGVLLSRIETSISQASLAGWSALFGGFTLHAVSVGFDEPVGVVRWTPITVLALGYLAAVVGAGGYVALLTLLREIGPTRTSLTSYLSPVVATLVGWSLLGESITLTTVGGLLVIAAGFVALNWSAAAAIRRRRVTTAAPSDRNES